MYRWGGARTDLKTTEQQPPTTGERPTSPVVDLTELRIRRALAPRLHGHGRIEVRRRQTTLTIVRRFDNARGQREVLLPIAQVRFEDDQASLYRRRASGRWVPYVSDEGPFRGSLPACLAEIVADRWGCFWS